MDTELKEKWVAALRSGEYMQGRGSLLRYDGTRCCLGVLEAVRGTPDETIRSRGYMAPGESELSRDVEVLLANMNDGHGDKDPMTFKEIADYIEANL